MNRVEQGLGRKNRPQQVDTKEQERTEILNRTLGKRDRDEREE